MRLTQTTCPKYQPTPPHSTIKKHPTISPLLNLLINFQTIRPIDWTNHRVPPFSNSLCRKIQSISFREQRDTGGRGRGRERVEGGTRTRRRKNKATPKKIRERKEKISGPVLMIESQPEIEAAISISIPPAGNRFRSCFQSWLFGLSFARAPFFLSFVCYFARAELKFIPNPAPTFCHPPTSIRVTFLSFFHFRRLVFQQLVSMHRRDEKIKWKKKREKK